MPVIRISDDVFKALQKQAGDLSIPFTTPDHILRIILRLDTSMYRGIRHQVKQPKDS